jgi:hypothetical protein
MSRKATIPYYLERSTITCLDQSQYYHSYVLPDLCESLFSSNEFEGANKADSDDGMGGTNLQGLNARKQEFFYIVLDECHLAKESDIREALAGRDLRSRLQFRCQMTQQTLRSLDLERVWSYSHDSLSVDLNPRTTSTLMQVQTSQHPCFCSIRPCSPKASQRFSDAARFLLGMVYQEKDTLYCASP